MSAAPSFQELHAAVSVARATPRPRPGRPVFWAAHVAFWAAAFGVNVLLTNVFAVADPLPFVAAEITLCFVATATLRWLSQREALLERLSVSNIGVVAGGALVSAVLITVVLLALRSPMGMPPASRPELCARLAITLTMIVNWCALYFGYQLVGDWYSTEVRALRAESLALRNELERLQAQISPHFLFNALNTVLAQRNDPEAIDTVTQALANYLHFLLRPSAPLEPLARELDALEEYLTVQGMRFGAGLETRIDCDFDARPITVPPTLVQPLVENAIKHGGRTSPKPLRVHVAARRQGEWLTIEVANTGRWVAPGGADTPGTGLASLRRRLQLQLGPEATLTHAEEAGWVRVVIRVPAVRVPGTAPGGAA